MGMGDQLRAAATLPPGKRPGTNCTGDWVCPTIGLDRREECPPTGGFDALTVQSVASR